MPRLYSVDAIDLIRTYRPDSKIIMNGSWVIHSCIIDLFQPHHKNGDANPSAGISLRSGAYNCFTYSDHSISFRELCTIIGRDYEFEPRDPPQPDDRRWLEDISDALGESQEQPLTLDIYSSYLHPYMTEVRHFSEKTLRDAKIHYDQFSGRIVIPIFERGRLIGLQKRVIPGTSTDGRWHAKYETTRGFRKSAHIYHIGELDSSKPILVFESVMSVMRAYDYGLTNSCAIFGSHMSYRQADILKRFPSVILWMDGDESGQRGVRDALRLLKGHQVYVVDSTEIGTKDIADIPRSRAVRLLTSAQTPEDLSLSRLPDV